MGTNHWERLSWSAYAVILGNITKFLVNYLYVAGSNLGHYEGDFIIISLLDNYY